MSLEHSVLPETKKVLKNKTKKHTLIIGWQKSTQAT